MPTDIARLLDDWPYDPDELVRRIKGDDGKPKLQVRLPLGIEQYDLDGRPDGKRPEGEESFLDVCLKRQAAYVAAHGSDEGFELIEDDCRRLHEEGLLYYYRYLLCYQIGEFKIVARDTDRNMQLFRFVGRYAQRDEDRTELEQYWPYIIRIRAMAGAFDILSKGDEKAAVESLRKAARAIENLPDVETPVFSLEKTRSVKIIEETIASIEAARPVSERDQLVKRLARAVRNENYEHAARLRDIIARMQD